MWGYCVIGTAHYTYKVVEMTVFTVQNGKLQRFSIGKRAHFAHGGRFPPAKGFGGGGNTAVSPTSL